MPPESDERPHPHRRGRALGWRLGTPVVVLLCGTLFAVSAEQSDGTDLRGGRYTDLASVVQAERRDTTRLTGEVAALTAEIDSLTRGLGDRSVNRSRREVERLSDPAGLTPKTGPAMQVILDDAPPEVQADESRDPLDIIVHQQDIQAVVNAMWRAGAVAVSIQGQRIISTTGIKCSGNSVTLQGVPYYPPYVIVGVADNTTDQIAMAISLEEDDYLDLYRESAADPRGGVSYFVADLPEATVPAYDKLLDLNYATPLPTT